MTTICVGNLDFATSEDELRTLFGGYGAVNTVTLLMDRDTGQPLGTAFVAMTSAGEARDSIRALNGCVHGGRALIVSEARSTLYPSGQYESFESRNHRRHRVFRGIRQTLYDGTV